jgi:hypothetical protein
MKNVWHKNEFYLPPIQEEKAQEKEKEGKWWKRELIVKMQF